MSKKEKHIKQKQHVMNLFLTHGFDKKKSKLMANVLTTSTEIGQDAHGFGRLEHYMNVLDSGKVKSTNKIKIINSDNSSILIDSSGCLGPLSIFDSIDLCLKKNAKKGVFIASIINADDIGRLGSYTEYIANNGFVSFVFSKKHDGKKVVSAFPNPKGYLHTNPFAFGCPYKKNKNISVDISTSQVSIGKIFEAYHQNILLPKNSLILKNGKLSRRPKDFIDGKATILPLGGEQFGYKGLGLGIMVEIIAGILTGHTQNENGIANNNSVLIIFINPAHFLSYEEFMSRISNLVSELGTVSGLRIPGIRKNFR